MFFERDLALHDWDSPVERPSCNLAMPFVSSSPRVAKPCPNNKAARGRLAKRWFAETGGARGSRTPDLVNAIHALSQLSYGPSGNQESVMSNQQESKLVG